MNAARSVRFKIASEESDFEQVFRLNYRTFVEELPQHPPNPEKRLVDRFHHENTYLIALDGDRVIGMMAVRDKRPFSLDEKLGNIDRYLPPGRKICEIRLLAVLPSHRNGMVFQGLLKLLLDYGLSQHYNLAVISGTVRQQKLYKHLGFVPFGRLVGPPEAQFQPMYLTLEEFEEVASPLLRQRPRAQSDQFPARPGQHPLRGPRRPRETACVAPVRSVQGGFCAHQNLALPTGARATRRNFYWLRDARQRRDRRAIVVAPRAGNHPEQRGVRRAPDRPGKTVRPLV